MSVTGGDDVIHVGVFGCGRIGRIHLETLAARAYSSSVRLVFVVDELIDATCAFIKRLGFDLSSVRVASPAETDSLLAMRPLDAILICSPTGTHRTIIEKAVEQNLPIFCEKPISLSLDETRLLYDFASKKQLLLFCSLNRRFDPSLDALKRKLNDDKSKIYSIRTVARDYPLPPMKFLATSGGVFHDCGIHDMDYVSWLMNERHPTEVFVLAARRHEDIKSMDDFDVALINMRFDCGAIASIELCRHSTYGYDQRCEVNTSTGMHQVRGEPEILVLTRCQEKENIKKFSFSWHCTFQFLALSVHELSTEILIPKKLLTNNQVRNAPSSLLSSSLLPSNVDAGSSVESFPSRYIDSYRAALDSFISCVRSGSTTCQNVLPESVCRSILLCEAAEASARQQKLIKIDYANYKLID